MRDKSLSIILRATVLIFTVTPFVTSSWAATETVLYNFHPEIPDGTHPEAGLIFDGAGNLYGTTSEGGAYGGGTVFELTPQAGGGWTKQVLYDFGNGSDGTYPYASLIFDAAGNLYGTTTEGGVYKRGTAFELTPQSGGGWTEKVLHSFGNLQDGATPYASLVLDADGNLYGTTSAGGTHTWGTVFELTPQAGGSWTEKVLHSFHRNGTDGYGPYAGLIFDAVGNLYGTTKYGGSYRHGGTVFKLTPKAGGGWAENMLYSFGTKNGAHPEAGLVFDAAGNLYGTTIGGGASHKKGTVFELTPQAGGGWTEKVLHSFNGTDGATPYAGLIFDAAGNLYGTTENLSTKNGGSVFELTPQAGGSWTEKVLYSFNINGPHSGLIFDAAGNLYGTDGRGGTYGIGTVFELTPQAGGGWTEQVLYTFNGTATDGASPYAGLISDAAGNLYGTTLEGGDSWGTVFELTPQAGGGWTEQVLHSFNAFNGTDGFLPYAGLIFDAAGNLYGTTSGGGTFGGGTVFELTPQSGGGWTEQVLYSFNQNGTDGYTPEAGVIFDAAGNLYGTTYWGGTYDHGTVFELTAQAGGGWTEQVLHSFNGTDGSHPNAGLIFDGVGNLYGTTSAGGTYDNGTVFELTAQAGGGWTENVLHSFNDNGTDGYNPQAGLVFDGSRNLYGTTMYGGLNGDGTVFELTPRAGGTWTENVLYDFGNGTDGHGPAAGLIFDGAGNLYGTTLFGGANSYGAVFELTPTGGGGWTEKVLHSFDINGTDGYNPYAGLIFDAAGNLYGTTLAGGTYNNGVVFEITP